MIVISLGGSVIVPDKVDYKTLHKLSKVFREYARHEKLIIVAGGGSTFRKYMKSVENEGLDSRSIGLIGIAATRLNARVVSVFFGKKGHIPATMLEVKRDIRKSDIVICGALGFRTGTTTDGNAAELARALKARMMINLTNVDGLYDKNPREYKSAKLVRGIKFTDFYELANKKKFKDGQHFVLDQRASRIIMEEKIPTVIMDGRKINNLKRMLKGERFIGTLID